MPVRCALYQPDIPQNAGTVIRTAMCLGVGLDIIEPMGFLWNEKRLRRAGMDYLDRADVVRHRSWLDYRKAVEGTGRLVLMTTRGATRLDGFQFEDGDHLILGRESAGVPDDVHDAADARVVIPLVPGMRSLNVAAAAAISIAEALRQLNRLPADTSRG
ncbi:MAG: TrmH family RNA methyltransferase [Rhodospirillales bacterium]